MLEGFFFFFCYSSQKIQMIQSPRCPLKEGLEFILGEAYFNWKDRGSLSCDYAGLFPHCTQQKWNIH